MGADACGPGRPRRGEPRHDCRCPPARFCSIVPDGESGYLPPAARGERVVSLGELADSLGAEVAALRTEVAVLRSQVEQDLPPTWRAPSGRARAVVGEAHVGSSVVASRRQPRRRPPAGGPAHANPGPPPERPRQPYYDPVVRRFGPAPDELGGRAGGSDRRFRFASRGSRCDVEGDRGRPGGHGQAAGLPDRPLQSWPPPD